MATFEMPPGFEGRRYAYWRVRAPNHVWVRAAPKADAEILGYETTGALVAATERSGDFLRLAGGGYAMIEKEGVGTLLVELEGAEAAAARLQQLRRDALAAEREDSRQAAYSRRAELPLMNGGAAAAADDG